jgi:hypothetical protein
VKYSNYSVLATQFGVSIPIIGDVIYGYVFGYYFFSCHGCIFILFRYLDVLVGFFAQYIPNALESDYCSTLSPKIVAVIDATIHAIRKPPHLQHLHYSGHYKMHGMLTHLLIDYEGNIVAFETNVLGSVHDANASLNNRLFPKILGPDTYALGDPGYAGVPYVVAGMKSNQLQTEDDYEFDKTSRHEQVVIEHVNSFLKHFSVLSKGKKFKHSRVVHVSCVVICCGWYNMMKTLHGAFERRLN